MQNSRMSKFHVSYEAAMLLREKGYNEVVESYYDTLGELNEVRSIFKNSVADNSFLHSFGDYYAAPTKAQAIDWFERKGLVIEVTSLRNGKWRFGLYQRGSFYIDSWIDYRLDFPTRLNAEDAAIKQGCKLLKR